MRCVDGALEVVCEMRWVNTWIFCGRKKMRGVVRVALSAGEPPRNEISLAKSSKTRYVVRESANNCGMHVFYVGRRAAESA